MAIIVSGISSAVRPYIAMAWSALSHQAFLQPLFPCPGKGTSVRSIIIASVTCCDSVTKKAAMGLGISRGQAKPRGSRVPVPAGTGAGRPGNTPDPCIPAMLHTYLE
jgi:hypothetical protein